MRRFLPLLALPLLALLPACANEVDDSPNTLPGDLAAQDATVADPDVGPLPDGGGPTYYRFTLIDIRQLGSQSQEQPGFQLQTLQRQWADDINKFILIIMLELDEAAGTLRVHSGSGTKNADLCIPAASSSEPFAITATDDGFSFSPDPAVTFRIYAEADDGTQLNCTVDPEVFDAVPLNGVQGTGNLFEEGRNLNGVLTACLSRREADTLCSCLGGQCRGGQHPRCPGCPAGSAPLSALLGGITEQDECITRLGEPGYMIVAGYETERVPTPTICP